MSKRLPVSVPADAPDQPPIWRSLGEKADPTRRTTRAVEEPAVQVPEKSILGRRTFLGVTSATAAAVGLSGCLRRPAENILPYTRAPEYALPGIPLHYATAVQHQGEAVGLLVETHEGRPTKVEGNPDHPSSLGKTDAQLQATILELYDPERPAHPSRKASGEARDAATWAQFDAWWREKAATLSTNGGRGLAVLAEPSDSPSFLRARQAFTQRFPNARVHTWSPVSTTNAQEGARLAFGEPLGTLVDYARARRVLAVDCDFLGTEPGAIRNQRRWAEARKLQGAPGPDEDTGRLYAVEGTLSTTGTSADHRLRLRPSLAGAYLKALAKALSGLEGVNMPEGVRTAVANAGEVAGVPGEWLTAVAADLASHRGQSVVCVGFRQPAHVHALAHAINEALGSVGAVVHHFAPVDADRPDQLASLRELTTAMREGEVDTLVILGGNPVYDAPADLQFQRVLDEVETSIHLSFLLDETSTRCTWHLPRAHAFESWGDHRSVDGLVALQQPLIAPLRGGRAEHEVLAMIGGIRGWRGYTLVRSTIREIVGASAQFERVWRQSLHRGIVLGGPRPTPIQATLRHTEVGEALGAREQAAEGWEVVFTPSYQTYDGRFANAPWLLEMPDPITKVTWDNAAYVSPASAGRLDIPVRDGGYAHGELITLSRDGAELTIPVFVVPGHADDVITLPLGWGRSAAGQYGTGAGFDVYPFRTSETLGFATGVRASRASGSHVLAQTQEHHSMEGRPLVIDATLEQYRETPDFAQWRAPTPDLGPLWTQVDYSQPRPPAQGGTTYSLYPEPRVPRPGAPPRYKWGFAVDLTTCTGCSACVVACQAENNIPVVGKLQVARGREMHWMRVDRYYVGESDSDPQVGIQPMFCQHCEEAPCENVCPVNATAHSPEGINEMAYNRCVGTRYCMNNCPYKVRRFNYLDWHGELDELERMKFNPNVTVRMRGVMEKCTYCVQRIQAARIRSRQDTVVGADGEIMHPASEEDVRARRARSIGELIEGERRVRPEEVMPACAQACPSDALVFGDLNDTESEVHRLAHLDRQYKVLASIGTQPRNTYLGKIRNLNPEMV